MAHMSFLDPQGELPVDEELWVVALLRKPKGSNPEHAFIMVEGCNSGGQVYFIRYDLTIDEDNPNSYEIHLLEPQNVSLARAASTLLINFLNGDEVWGQCWPIPKSKVKELHNMVLKEKVNPGTYNLLGNQALLPHTVGVSHAVSPNAAQVIGEKISEGVEAISGANAAARSKEILKPSGHNCFTWGREMLLLLKLSEIERALPRKPEELIASVTSRHIKQSSGTPCDTGTKGLCRIM